MIIKMILTNAFDPDPRVYKEAKALVSEGHDIEILCWDRDNRYSDKPVEVLDNIKIRRFFPKSLYGSGFKQIISYWQFIRQVNQYLKKIDYDIVHGHDIDGVLVGCFLEKSKKLIWDMHEFYDGFNYGFIKRNVYELIAKKCFKEADGLIYVLDSQKKRYSNKKNPGIPEAVIMNAPEEEIFDKFNRQSSDKLRISFIGSVRDYESLKLLMSVGEKFSNVVINLNGIGTAYEDLKKIQHKYKNTKMTGKFHYAEIKKLYEDTDIVYAVYNSELINVKHAFPVKGFEAILTGTPVIANKNTYFGEFVEKNDIGFLIDSGNERQLIEVVNDILENQRLIKTKVHNVEKIKKKFLWREQSEELIKFYKQLKSK